MDILLLPLSNNFLLTDLPSSAYMPLVTESSVLPKTVNPFAEYKKISSLGISKINLSLWPETSSLSYTLKSSGCVETTLCVQNCVRFGWGDIGKIRHGLCLGEGQSWTLEAL